MSAAGTLDIRQVDIVFRSQNEVFVATGVEDGEALVVTDLAAPVEGMSLRRKGNGESSAQIGTETSQ